MRNYLREVVEILVTLLDGSWSFQPCFRSAGQELRNLSPLRVGQEQIFKGNFVLPPLLSLHLWRLSNERPGPRYLDAMQMPPVDPLEVEDSPAATSPPPPLSLSVTAASSWSPPGWPDSAACSFSDGLPIDTSSR